LYTPTPYRPPWAWTTLPEVSVRPGAGPVGAGVEAPCGGALVQPARIPAPSTAPVPRRPRLVRGVVLSVILVVSFV
jgi:hypothetical protein